MKEDWRILLQSLSTSGPEISIVSNSVNLESSLRNLELSELSSRIIPFVGIHPDAFKPDANKKEFTLELLDKMVDGIQDAAGRSRGIGEIGLDPKYGSDKAQEKLFREMLSISESTSLPSSIHNRSSVSRILEIISTFALKGSVLLHWFAGTEQELAEISEKGMFVSYGPSILTSKRMRSLVERTPLDLLLAETDSPTPFASLHNSLGTPFLIASVVFEIGLIKKIPFQEVNEKIESNLWKYLGTQNSLRVKT